MSAIVGIVNVVLEQGWSTIGAMLLIFYTIGKEPIYLDTITLNPISLAAIDSS